MVNTKDEKNKKPDRNGTQTLNCIMDIVYKLFKNV